MAEIKKWGFGAAPYKLDTLNKNRRALKCVLSYIDKQSISVIDICNEISIVKGLFNRIIRQDQWDWFMAYMYFDYPSHQECLNIVRLLSGLRTAIKNDNIGEVENVLLHIQKTNFILYTNRFLEFDVNSDDTDEYIYILSRREEKDLLKIGLTTRNVLKRCQEINAATGVVFPYLPRKVFRVKDSKEAEKIVHHALQEYRIRADREFFKCNYSEACKVIEGCLKEMELLYYKY
ncbi:MAG: GIY-YIG nuclease family protein [Lachnospiraceae bacterium]|nr:GIY-YIG nuclease family protein [Lachnospiraceae bacterium]